MDADALATVFMAMPPDAALDLANRRGVAALLVVRDAGGLGVRRSAAWPAR
jgi:thiamine biosynthesis lipoprotein ApbE